MDGITFAVFHVDPKNGKSPHPTAIFKKNEYHEMLVLFFESAKRFHQNCRFVLLTDHETNVRSLPHYVEIVRGVVNFERLMFDRLMSQSSYIQSCKHSNPVIFADCDMLFSSSINHIFDNLFDIGLTWRNLDEMPINGGLIIVRNPSSAPAKSFFGDLVSAYSSLSGSNFQWWGDQYALSKIVNISSGEIEEFGANPILRVKNYSVMLLPCSEYNYSPDNYYSQIRVSSSAHILHFKGPRKRLMKAYYDAHLSDASKTKGALKSALAKYKIVIWSFCEGLVRYIETSKNKLQRLRSAETRRAKPFGSKYCVIHNGSLFEENKNTKSPFSLEHQKNNGWIARAKAAADFINGIQSLDKSIKIADIGCGDKKLLWLLATLNIPIEYHGFDLMPQSSDVVRFDLRTEQLLENYDVVVMLGVIEYLENISDVMKKLTHKCRYLIVSHVISDSEVYTPVEIRRLGWLTHLKRAEFESIFSGLGYRIVCAQPVDDGKTIVWLLEKYE